MKPTLNLIQFLLLFLLNYTSTAFIFHAPFVDCTSLQINTSTTCTFRLDRSSGITIGVNTAWNTTSVLNQSTITVIFPSQYTLTGNEQCSLLTITDNSSTSLDLCAQANWVVNPSNNTITIEKAITSDTYIK
jgi:hypothetical protein